MKRIQKTNEEWKKQLDSNTYHITREAGTEAAFTGKYWNEHSKGVYKCSNCGLELFSSDTKFDSGTGWPSFTEAVNREHIDLKEDKSHGMSRVEVLCKRCGAHLGHVFDDLSAEVKTKAGGPHCRRFCINSASIELKKEPGES